MKRKPYTYRIGWTEHDIYYYGVRWGNSQKHPKKDLWVRYFTSCSIMPQLRETYGEPDLIEVRKIFESKHDAIRWERKVLNRLAQKSPNYANHHHIENKEFF